jgi:hypothetical protein
MLKSNFERKTMDLLPFREFVLRLVRFFMFSLLLILFSLGLGTYGYHHFGEIPWIDSFYNASLILTGMGPVNEMHTVAAKLFASFYALFSGIVFLSTVAVIFAPIAHRLMHLFHLQETDVE